MQFLKVFEVLPEYPNLLYSSPADILSLSNSVSISTLIWSFVRRFDSKLVSFVSNSTSTSFLSKASCIGIITEKNYLSSSVSNVGNGEPFSLIALIAVGIPVFLPSTRCNSFKKSPILRFLYLLVLI